MSTTDNTKKRSQQQTSGSEKVTDSYVRYAGKYGLSADAIGYSPDDGGKVSVGGTNINVSKTDSGGKAWASPSSVKNAVDNYASELGVKSPNDIYSDYAANLRSVKNSIENLKNRREFTYDPDSDPVYQSYKKRYALEGSRAAEDGMSQYMSLTGGYANSAAASAGAMARQYYAQQTANVIPELAQQAYERYIGSLNADIDLINLQLEMYGSDYEAAMQSNNRTVDNANYTAEQVRQRDKDAWERSWQDLFNNQTYSKGEQDYALGQQQIKLNDQQYDMNTQDAYWKGQNAMQDYKWTEYMNPYILQGLELDNEGKELDNENKEISNKYLPQELLSKIFKNYK